MFFLPCTRKSTRRPSNPSETGCDSQSQTNSPPSEEIYYTGDVAEKIEKVMEMVKQLMQEITVIDYGKVA